MEERSLFEKPAETKETPSIFVQIEPGKIFRGIFAGWLPTNDARYPDQPIVYSLKRGECIVLPGHMLLVDMLAEMKPPVPVEITRLADSGNARKYRVSRFAAEGLTAEDAVKIGAAVEALRVRVAEIRGKGRVITSAVSGGPGAPGAERAPLPDDSDLPF